MGLSYFFPIITLPLFIYLNDDRFPAVVYFYPHFKILLHNVDIVGIGVR